jgi:hypothetical protein
MYRLLRGALAVACFTAVSGCTGFITGGDLIRPGEPTGTIEIVNNTGGVIDVVSISDCKASTYGFDRLPDNTVIAAGTSYKFTVSAGCWDVDAGSIGVGEARQRMDVSAGGNTRYTVTD